MSIVEAPFKGKALLATKAIILHYTASESGSATVKYLAKATVAASTHLVIDRDGTITQLVPLEIAAFHAGKSSWNGLTGLNQYSIAIDLINIGQLEREGGKSSNKSVVRLLLDFQGHFAETHGPSPREA